MKMLPSARYKIWQNVKKQAPADSIPQKQLLASKPTVAVVNHSRIDVNSAEPVTVLTADIELDSASKLKISGIVNGTFYYVCGLAIYVDDIAINATQQKTNNHSDCLISSYTSNTTKYIFPLPFLALSARLAIGKHVVKVAVLAKWNNKYKKIVINNRFSNDLPCSSTLLVEAI